MESCKPDDSISVAGPRQKSDHIPGKGLRSVSRWDFAAFARESDQSWTLEYGIIIDIYVKSY